MKNLLVTLFACATLSYANAAENPLECRHKKY